MGVGMYMGERLGFNASEGGGVLLGLRESAQEFLRHSYFDGVFGLFFCRLGEATAASLALSSCLFISCMRCFLNVVFVLEFSFCKGIS